MFLKNCVILLSGLIVSSPASKIKLPETPRPLTIHVLVPLCDNEHQGIVPVNKQLGDGFNLKTNLYWGAGYGVRSYFKLKVKWSMDTSYVPAGGIILERVVFSKTIGNKKVNLVADAYRGDAMRYCLHDYLRSLSGNMKQTIRVKGNSIPVYSNAGLLVFNGHNGLMDTSFAAYPTVDSVRRDAAVIACASKLYFMEHFDYTYSNPVITTTGLMAPEAYVLEALITAWVQKKSGIEIKRACGNAYHAKHPSSSAGACIGLFHSGR